MSRIIQVRRKPVTAADATIVNTDDSVSTSNLDEYTFSSQALGTASADRHIIVGITGRANSGGAFALSSVTVAGNAASVVVEHQYTNDIIGTVALAIVAVPSGTTGDVVVTWDRAILDCGIGVWATTGLQSITPTDTDFDSPGTSLSGNLNIDAGGVAVGVTLGFSAPAVSWTNLTEDFETQIDSGEDITGASDAFVTEQTALAISVSQVGANTNCGLALASFR
jgi:hypothetical protein